MIIKTADSRCYHLDFLRVFAAYAVVVIYTSARTHTSTVSQEIFGFYGRIAGWAVPIVPYDKRLTFPQQRNSRQKTLWEIHSQDIYGFSVLVICLCPSSIHRNKRRFANHT